MRLWRSVSRVRLAARTSSASSFWRPKVSPQSNFARSTFSPGLMRVSSRRLCWVSFLAIAALLPLRSLVSSGHRNAGAGDRSRTGSRSRARVEGDSESRRRTRRPAPAPGGRRRVASPSPRRRRGRGALASKTHRTRVLAPPARQWSTAVSSSALPRPCRHALCEHVDRVDLGRGEWHVLVPRRAAAHEADDAAGALGDPGRSAAVHVPGQHLVPGDLAGVDSHRIEEVVGEYPSIGGPPARDGHLGDGAGVGRGRPGGSGTPGASTSPVRRASIATSGSVARLIWLALPAGLECRPASRPDDRARSASVGSARKVRAPQRRVAGNARPP